MKKSRKFVAIILSALALVFLGAYAYGSWFFASVLIARPTQTLAESAALVKKTPADVGLPAPADVTFSSGEVTLAGWYFANERDGDCGVVLLHGYTSTRYGVLNYAPLFWERGCDLLLYDARGHGESNGRYHTYGYYEKEDARAAALWLAAQSGLPLGKIGLMGVSYGAATSLQAAPLLPELAFIIADSPYQDLETIIRYQAVQQYGPAVQIMIPGAWLVAELRANFDVEDVSPANSAAQAQPPILLIHSLSDTYTPPANSQAIYARSNLSRTVLHLTDWGASHGDDIKINFGGYVELVDLFLQSYAPGFGRSD